MVLIENDQMHVVCMSFILYILKKINIKASKILICVYYFILLILECNAFSNKGKEVFSAGCENPTYCYKNKISKSSFIFDISVHW